MRTLLFLLIGTLSCFGDFSIEEYKQKAKAGDAQAQYDLALMYAKGEGVPKNKREGAEWLIAAAENGHRGAQLRLGMCYTIGAEGLPRDIPFAMMWYTKAAENGDLKGAINMGIMYRPDDRIQSYKWWCIALEFGLSEEAENQLRQYGTEKTPEQIASYIRSNIEKVSEKMSPKEIAEARKLAEEWLEEHKE